MSDYRIEKDSMGEVKVPENAYYGAQTQRAFDNFPVSGIVFSREFIEAVGIVKQIAAKVNGNLGMIDSTVAEAISEAAQEVAEGKLDDQFIVDIFQTGSGTSTNMNANEVIAKRANELKGKVLKLRSIRMIM
jgi:fumarate hydratase, class II